MTHYIYPNILCHWFSLSQGFLIVLDHLFKMLLIVHDSLYRGGYSSRMDRSETLLFLSHDSFIGCEYKFSWFVSRKCYFSPPGLIMEIFNICPDWFSLPGMFLVTFGSLVRCDITSSMILYSTVFLVAFGSLWRAVFLLDWFFFHPWC